MFFVSYIKRSHDLKWPLITRKVNIMSSWSSSAVFNLVTKNPIPFKFCQWSHCVVACKKSVRDFRISALFRSSKLIFFQQKSYFFRMHIVQGKRKSLTITNKLLWTNSSGNRWCFSLSYIKRPPVLKSNCLRSVLEHFLLFLSHLSLDFCFLLSNDVANWELSSKRTPFKNQLRNDEKFQGLPSCLKTIHSI